MTIRTRLAGAALATALTLAAMLTGCSTGTDSAASAAGTVVTITVKDMSYQPAEVTIHPGDTVEWIFDDGGMPHDVSGEGEMEGILQSELLTEGKYTYTFDETGTYTYSYTPHPMMVGTVVVEE